MLDEKQFAPPRKRVASFAWQHRARSHLVMSVTSRHLIDAVSQIKEHQGAQEPRQPEGETQGPPG